MAKAKATDTKKTEEVKKPTLSEVIRGIDATRVSTPVKKIVSEKKSKRGPNSAGRISGLQGLNPRLGQQFS